MTPPDQVLSTDELVRAVGLYLKREGRWPEGFQATISFEARQEGDAVRFTSHVQWSPEPAK